MEWWRVVRKYTVIRANAINPHSIFLTTRISTKKDEYILFYLKRGYTPFYLKCLTFLPYPPLFFSISSGEIKSSLDKITFTIIYSSITLIVWTTFNLVYG